MEQAQNKVEKIIKLSKYTIFNDFKRKKRAVLIQKLKQNKIKTAAFK